MSSEVCAEYPADATETFPRVYSSDEVKTAFLARGMRAYLAAHYASSGIIRDIPWGGLATYADAFVLQCMTHREAIAAAKAVLRSSSKT